MKNSTYSNQFQMHEHRGTFNGLDSFSITYFHCFDFILKLSADSEAMSLMNCMNINAPFTQLTEEKAIGKCIANSTREKYLKMTKNINFTAFYCISKKIPLGVSMSKENELTDNLITAIVDNREDDQP